ncbi:MAG TPA: 16S rRNA (cytosine(1402)-N(4))-methyltransferase RsmH [Alphaproteobacteria bacterium]|jgi:16S rRNA (cytosine1402-N4)-methyltransferase|nr:16S rRNA (cytosine(1402)-N(4))-methyltransferase RsmH [Alphaproteobacteria bacterium]
MNFHETVLVEEVIEALHVKKSGKYIDATLGNGGHTLEILKHGGQVLGIERDPEMLAISKERLGGKALLVNGNFVDIDKIAKENNWQPVSGILFDLGVTNLHLKSLERGFSFENPEAILDMRLNPNIQGVKAADLLNVLREDQVEEMFKTVMEPGHARWITKRVIEKRSQELIKTVGDFLQICEGLKTGKSNIHEATLPFLALRIAVNSELDNLKVGLEKAFKLLEKGGWLVVISFHSGEDKIVKEFLKYSKLVVPGENELAINRRARSARLRILQK